MPDVLFVRGAPCPRAPPAGSGKLNARRSEGPSAHPRRASAGNRSSRSGVRLYDASEVSQKLKDAPPVPFDVARQVRVFESYLQYVELRLPGVAIQRRRIAIPRKPADVPTTWTLAGILEAVALLPSNNQLIIASNATPFESREGHLRDRWPWQPFAYRGHLFSGA
jgi:hypothetical protein